MNSFKQHIALVLLVIFTFPIAYQPYHMVMHHSADTECHHHCCHAEPARTSGILLEPYSAEDENCPICDYHFPVNDLPKLSLFSTVERLLLTSISDSEIEQIRQQIISTKSPRGPPLQYT